MDQTKTGALIRTLRKEKGLTQEQLAERFGVSRRSVSRWETGMNLPDLDLLIELADFYAVDLRELIDGERNVEIMNEETKETVMKVAEYANAESTRATKLVLVYFVLGIVSLLLNQAMFMFAEGDGFWPGFFEGLTMAFALCAMVFGLLHVTGTLQKLMNAKRRMFRKMTGGKA